jgi:SPX domain protein involved in polyphosphate accumulation
MNKVNVSGTAVRRFNRFELKYIVPRSVGKAFRKEIIDHLVPDRRGGTYYLSSLYYDSPRYGCYAEKIEGDKVRRKVRIRHYETADALTPDTTVFVEVKQRVNRVTQKRRTPMRYADAAALCTDRVAPLMDEPQDQAVVDEVYGLCSQWQLRPTAITSYQREAWEGTDYDPGTRVTIDTNIRYRVADLDLSSKNAGRYAYHPMIELIEVKVNERIPSWLAEIVSRLDLTITRTSKYCQSIEAGGCQPATSLILPADLDPRFRKIR